MTTEYVVYHICRLGDIDDLSKGYVGISSNYKQRWLWHKVGYSGSEILNRAWQKYDDIVERVLVVGSEEYCKDVEAKLRPFSRMGWNIAPGGGLPPNLSGKIMTQSQKDKIGASNSGANNSKWKGYWVIDGVKHISMNAACKSVGCAKRTIRNRALSNDFPNYYFEPAAMPPTH